MDTAKPAWQSKTLWSNLIVAVLAMAFPPAKDFFTAHPEAEALLFMVMNFLLRFITKQPVTIS